MTIRKAGLFTFGLLLYCLFRVTNDVTVSGSARQYVDPLRSLTAAGGRPAQPKLKVVAFDLSPPTANDTNLANPGPDFPIRLGSGPPRICCNYSVSRIVYVDNVCQLYVYGSNLTLRGPWNWVVYHAVKEAYLLGADYFLILNDRSRLQHDWARQYIETLLSLDPPNVGIAVTNSPVGPRKVFFHRTHIDIFGYVYPWNIRTSSTFVYLENLYPEDVRLDIDSTTPQLATEVQGPNDDVLPWIKENRYHLFRYLASRRLPRRSRDGQVKVISFSLYSNTPKYVEGAIRNAQLSSVIFPDWSIRFYVPHPNATTVPRPRDDVIATLRRLGAQVEYVADGVRAAVPPMMWRYLVADDPEVDVFLIQDSDSRLSDRLKSALDVWLTADNASVYCMRDHPWHSASPMSGGLWAARRAAFGRLIGGRLLADMAQFNDSYGQDMAFLGRMVWPRVRGHVYCHDSVSCYHWTNSHPWPRPRRALEHVGEIYDEFHVPLPSNRLKLNETAQHAYCEPLPRINAAV